MNISASFAASDMMTKIQSIIHDLPAEKLEAISSLDITWVSIDGIHLPELRLEFVVDETEATTRETSVISPITPLREDANHDVDVEESTAVNWACSFSQEERNEIADNHLVIDCVDQNTRDEILVFDDMSICRSIFVVPGIYQRLYIDKQQLRSLIYEQTNMALKLSRSWLSIFHSRKIARCIDFVGQLNRAIQLVCGVNDDERLTK